MALLNTMTWALEADTVEYGEYKTGIRTEGATYAAFSFTRKVGQAVGAAIAGYGLAWAGYNGALKGTGQTQPPEVLDRMQQAAGAPPFVASRRPADHGHLPAHRGQVPGDRGGHPDPPDAAPGGTGQRARVTVEPRVAPRVGSLHALEHRGEPWPPPIHMVSRP